MSEMIFDYFRGTSAGLFTLLFLSSMLAPTFLVLSSVPTAMPVQGGGTITEAGGLDGIGLFERTALREVKTLRDFKTLEGAVLAGVGATVAPMLTAGTVAATEYEWTVNPNLIKSEGGWDLIPYWFNWAATQLKSIPFVDPNSVDDFGEFTAGDDYYRYDESDPSNQHFVYWAGDGSVWLMTNDWDQDPTRAYSARFGQGEFGTLGTPMPHLPIAGKGTLTLRAEVGSYGSTFVVAPSWTGIKFDAWAKVDDGDGDPSNDKSLVLEMYFMGYGLNDPAAWALQNPLFNGNEVVRMLGPDIYDYMIRLPAFPRYAKITTNPDGSQSFEIDLKGIFQRAAWHHGLDLNDLRLFEVSIDMEAGAVMNGGPVTAWAELRQLKVTYTDAAPGQIGSVPKYILNGDPVNLIWTNAHPRTVISEFLNLGWQRVEGAGEASIAQLGKLHPEDSPDAFSAYEDTVMNLVDWALDTTFFNKRYHLRIYDGGTDPTYGRITYGAVHLEDWVGIPNGGHGVESWEEAELEVAQDWARSPLAESVETYEMNYGVLEKNGVPYDGYATLIKLGDTEEPAGTWVKESWDLDTVKISWSQLFGLVSGTSRVFNTTVEAYTHDNGDKEIRVVGQLDANAGSITTTLTIRTLMLDSEIVVNEFDTHGSWQLPPWIRKEGVMDGSYYYRIPSVDLTMLGWGTADFDVTIRPANPNETFTLYIEVNSTGAALSAAIDIFKLAMLPVSAVEGTLSLLDLASLARIPNVIDYLDGGNAVWIKKPWPVPPKDPGRSPLPPISQSAMGPPSTPGTEPEPVPPLAMFTYSPSVNPTAGRTIYFTDMSQGNIVSWSWDFGDPTTNSDTSTYQHTTYKYPDQGSYTVTLTVEDDQNQTGTEQKTITVLNADPVARFTYTPALPYTVDTVQFTNESVDLETNDWIAETKWDFGDENSTGWLAGKQGASHSYADNGTYTVTLTVRDEDDGENSVSMEITVLNTPPTAKFSYTPENITTADTVEFIDQSVDEGGLPGKSGHIVSWHWDFGDGTTATYTTPTNPTHNYSLSGSYEVTLTVTDEDGAKDTHRELLIVTAEPWNAPPHIVYYDNRYPTAWINEENAKAIASHLASNGFTILNADNLKKYMQMAGAGTVVVMAQDIAPDTVADVKSSSAIIRQYLDRGGTVVWMGDVPFYYQGHADGTSTTWGTSGMVDVLGVQHGAWNIGDTVEITGYGERRGLTQTWASVRPADESSLTGAQDRILATATVSDDAAAWLKNMNASFPNTGFLRLWDRGGGFTSNDDNYLADLLYVPLQWRYVLTVYNADTSPAPVYLRINGNTRHVMTADPGKNTSTVRYFPATWMDPTYTSFSAWVDTSATDSKVVNLQITPPHASTQYITVFTNETSYGDNRARTLLTLPIYDLMGTLDNWTITGDANGKWTLSNAWSRSSPNSAKSTQYNNYNPNTDTTMERNVDVRNYAQVATFMYYYHVRTGESADKLQFKFFDGAWNTPRTRSRTADGWDRVSVPSSTEKVQFHFTSDGDATVGEGAYVDDVIFAATNKFPRPHFTYSSIKGEEPASPVTGDMIMFTDQSTDDRRVVSWHWDFGDGRIFTTMEPTQKNPTHQYIDNGTYDVILTVKDDSGAEVRYSKSITVLNRAPQASFTWSQIRGNLILFESTSDDLDGTIENWSWDFGDGSSDNYAHTASMTHRYETAGTYTVKLTVTDDDEATDTYSEVITVTDNPPTVTTQSASSVGKYSATLNMDYDFADYGPGRLQFVYWKQSDPGSTYSTGWETASGSGSYSKSISGLSSGTTYEFKAQLEDVDGTVYEGGIKEFKTSSGGGGGGGGPWFFKCVRLI